MPSFYPFEYMFGKYALWQPHLHPYRFHLSALSYKWG
jgi:hypothetical protein